MQISLTVADPATGEHIDLLLDADPRTPVSRIQAALTAWMRGGDTTPPGPRPDELLGVAPVYSLSAHRARTNPPLSPSAREAGLTSATTLFVDSRPLEPSQALADSPLRDGALVSIGGPEACPPPEPDGLVEIRVVGGPGAGTLHRLGVSEFTIGSDPTCGLAVADPRIAPVAVLVSVKPSAAVTLVPTSTAATDTSGHPEPLLDGVPLDDPTPWPVGGLLALGPVLIELALPTHRDAALQPSADGAGLDYNRPPRLLPPERRTVFRLPSPPQDQHRRRLPWIAVLLPLAFGVGMAWIWGQPRYLAFALMSPLMMLGNYVYERRSGRESHRQRMADYRARRARIEADAREALDRERVARREAAPDAAALLLTATGPRTRLWERRRDDPDHLCVRFGTGTVDSEVTLEDPEQLEHRRTVRWQALDVPVAIPLGERGVAGIAGQGEEPRRLAAWVVAQLAVLQSPRDLHLYVLTEPAKLSTWSWVRWLPHARPQAGQETVALIGADTETLARRVGELTTLVAARQRARREHDDTVLNEPDVVVVLDGARRLRSLPGVVQVLREGPAVGVHTLCLDVDRRLLPEECDAVLVRTGPSWRLEQQRTATVENVRADLVPWPWFERVARALAPIRDVTDTGQDLALPASCRLLDVLDLDPPDPAAVAARWAIGGRTTRAVVGASLDGPFALDLVRDGPHGLIAGTTGAGKSELLQSLVASLAVANRPDAMTFVLIDYKGGAAFKDCVDLPHTVGMVTDLDPHLVERALTSLGAELRRRERILAAAGAKDIEDYTALQRRRGPGARTPGGLPAAPGARTPGGLPDLAPLPRLVLVVDEFASMARELPDFVTGLVNIAQRGRSLGVHLLLATQRPSGVVSPEIRANTNLRVALRVTDPAESSDVIDAPDAARIAKSTPGRAYARLGHASLIPFQTARVGGHGTHGTAHHMTRGTARGGEEAAPLVVPWVTAIGWDRLGQPVPRRPADPDGRSRTDLTDLAALVEAVRAASTRLELPRQHSPWLPALGEHLLLSEIDSGVPADAPVQELFGPGSPGPDALSPGRGLAQDPTAPWRLPPIPYGLVDVPAEQDRRHALLDLDRDGHLFVVGSQRSGRSQALRTIAGSAALRMSTADLHLYGLDSGNGGLLPLTALPHCGAVVLRGQVDRVQRLLARLVAELIRRQDVLGQGGFADVTEQRAHAPADRRLPQVLFLLHRWDGFLSGLGEVDSGALTDQVAVLLREGASVGIHVVMSGDRSLLSGRMSAMTEDKLVLRLADRTDYSLAGIPPRTVPDEIPPGRGFRADSGLETQVALLAEDPGGPAQAEALRAIAEAAHARDAALAPDRRPFRVDLLPSRLSFEDAWRMRDGREPSPLWGMVGVGGDELVALGPDLADGAPTFVVAGPARSGRSTLLLTMARSFLVQGAHVVLAAPRPSPLRELDGAPGVRATFTGDDLTEEDLAATLTADTRPVVLVVDDAEQFRDCAAKDWLRRFLRTCGDRRAGVVVGGNAQEVCNGFTGWQVDIRRNRRGALLSPQNVTDSDLVGATLHRSDLGGPVVPGRAFVHLGDGRTVAVQVPCTTPAG